MIAHLLLVFLASGAHAAITVDFNCTKNDAGTFKYNAGAVVCSDALSTASCRALFGGSPAPTTWPEADTDNARPTLCYSNGATPVAIDESIKSVAIANCPKTCGYCCLTDAYNCQNVQFPRLKCDGITAAQCNSVTWRTIIAADCPAACGFCGQGGCVDAVTNCGTDLSICQNIGMQDFVNQYCQKTCARCPSTTTASSSGSATTSSGSCTSYIADSSTACSAWATNGFCTNTFYTYEQRRARCATTCRLC